MASFILIHGSWHGGWCFDGIKLLLEGQGHEVIAPDLPGMDGNEQKLRAITLQGWADFATGLCRKATQKPVILVGHSRGGLVVSQAAETAPDAIDALVYICAMMLPDGVSRVQFKQLEGPNPGFDGIVSPVANGAGTAVDGERGREIFAQLSPENLVDEAMRRLAVEPHGPRSEPLRLTAVRFGSLPRTYIECTEDRTIPIASQRKMQKLVPGADIVTLHADHSPFLSRPEKLVAALIAAADKVSF